MVGLDSVSFVRVQLVIFFGRAGNVHPDPSFLQSREHGAVAVYWSSVVPADEFVHYLYFNPTVMDPSYSDSRAGGYPLRCLAHGTAG